MLSKRISKMLLSGAAVGLMAGAANAAGLNIDIRATGVNGAPLGAGQTSKLIPVVNVGDVVTFDIFAVVTGTNASLTDDKIVSASGSWKSSNGGLKGNILADYVRSDDNVPIIGYDANGASVGLQTDLDGDGDLDVGSHNDSAANDFWAARYQTTNGQSASNPTGRKIGFGTFTVTGSTNLGTDVNFIGRNASTAGNYFQDGVFVSAPTVDGAVPLHIGGGGGTVPEPATLSLAGLAGLAMVRRRRA